MSENLGARLREARQRRGLSLRSVAHSLGVSASLISQVEIGKTQPSVSTLYALAHHLSASLDELLGLEPTNASNPTVPLDHGIPLPVVQHGNENPVIEMENGVRWERLAAHPGGPADALLVTYAPGASSSVEGRLMRHGGVEYAYLLEGEITLQLEFDSHVLRAGDSLQFDSLRPHLYTNHGPSVARGIWFVVGRRQYGKDLPAAPGEPFGSVVPGSAIDVLRAIDHLT